MKLTQPLKIGPKPKRKPDHLPTINFQVGTGVNFSECNPDLYRPGHKMKKLPESSGQIVKASPISNTFLGFLGDRVPLFTNAVHILYWTVKVITSKNQYRKVVNINIHSIHKNQKKIILVICWNHDWPIMTLCFLPSPTLTGSRLVHPSSQVHCAQLCPQIEYSSPMVCIQMVHMFKGIFTSWVSSKYSESPAKMYVCVLCIWYIYINIQVCQVNQEDKSCFLYKPIGRVMFHWTMIFPDWTNLWENLENGDLAQVWEEFPSHV